MSNSFEMAWGVVKGQSSDFDWFRPGWKRRIEGQRQLATQMPQERTGIWNELPRDTVDRWLEEDLEDDAMDNPNPAVNDALASIGEPNLTSRKAGGSFGNKIGSKLKGLNRQRRQNWGDSEWWDR